MKLIDLLNKIAKGEEVPKKIMIYGDIYEYKDDVYQDDKGRLLFEKYNFRLLTYDAIILDDEEENKIPDKIYWVINDDNYKTIINNREYKGNKDNFEELSDMYRQKINEIIDYLEKEIIK